MASSKKSLASLVLRLLDDYIYVPQAFLFFLILGQLKSPLEAGHVSSALTCHSFVGDGLGAADLELNCKSMAENTMKTEPAPPLAELEEISTVAGSYLELT